MQSSEMLCCEICDSSSVGSRLMRLCKVGTEGGAVAGEGADCQATEQ